ncbi:hypothetical protein [Beijerinckia sp. L45]|uniref:hypothetical protein n=1 Tax=Beijerinckia sp. L45 TaxID=1641855 RepID=UPI00131B11E5|nr:hypothetical protein [Beijerinckia sp. L45]
MRHAPNNPPAKVGCQPSNVARRPTFVSASEVGERVCEYLRQLYPQRTVDNVAADVASWHVSRFTVAKMFERQTAPGAVLWVALIDAYGPDFLAAALPKQLGWLDDAARTQRREALEARMAAIKSELDGLR